MIPDFKLKVEREDWQRELKSAFTNLDDLLVFLNLSPDSLNLPANLHFPIRVPRNYAQKIQKGCPSDPLLRQVLPAHLESEQAAYVNDPLQESQANPIQGLLHKFKHRALLITGQSCAIHCQYCFRQHFPYQANRNSKQSWMQAFDYIRNHPEIYEVILSGGDPLNLSDSMLQWFIDNLEAIPHLKLLRIHTRTGLVIPSRITHQLCEMLAKTRLQVAVVFHCNHPQEIDQQVAQACKRLRAKHITMLNQSVLLKGVNDCPQTLETLSLALYALGVLPYYIHHLDKVKGSAGFEVALPRAQSILEQLHGLLPGYLVPKFVQEVPSKPAKVPITLNV